MNKSTKIVIGIVVATLIIGANWFLLRQKTPKETGVIKIGAIFPLSGQSAVDGNNAMDGIKLAVKEINVNNGIDGKMIEVVAEDSQGDDPKEVINAYNALKLRGINLIIGPLYSPAGQALSPISCKDKSILVAPAIGIKGFTSPDCKYTFDLWPVDFNNSKSFGKYVVQKGYKRIAVIGSTQSWCNEQAQGFNEGVKEAGGNVVSYVVTVDTDRDFLPDITKINNAKPDAIIFANYFTMNVFAKKLREYANTAQFFLALTNNTDIENAQGALEGAITITPFTPTQAFADKFNQEYDKNPGFPADSSYDAVNFITDAINKTGTTDPNKIQQYLHTIKSYNGASGSLTFGDNGQAIKDYLFYIVKNGKLTPFDGSIN